MIIFNLVFWLMIANDQCSMSPLQEELEKSCAAAVEADAQLKALPSGAGADVNIVDVVLGTMNVGIFKSYLNSITNIHNNALYWFVFPFRTLALMNIPIQWIGQGTLVPS